MITKVRLEKLLASLREEKTTGTITIEGALALIETVRRGGGWFYRVDVGRLTVHTEHHASWTAIFVDVTAEGIQLMKQRWTSCPGCTSAACREIDLRPVRMKGQEEYDFFVKWAHAIVVSEDVLRLLKANNTYPFKEYPLVASEARALAGLPWDLRELFVTIRKVVLILVETKGSFKSARLADARRQLLWSLERRSLSIDG